MKRILLLCGLAVASACSSSGGGAGGNGAGGGGEGNTKGPGGNAGTGSCADPSTIFVPDAKRDVGAIGLDAANVYFVRNGVGGYSIPKAGGTATALFSTTHFSLLLQNVLLVDAGTVYLPTADGIYKFPATGGDPTLWVPSENMDQTLAMDPDYIYVADDTLDTDGKPHGSIKRVKKTDGTVTTLATGLAGPTGVVLAGDVLYWQNMGSSKEFLAVASDGGLMSMPKAGGPPKTLFVPPADGSGIKLAGSFSDLVSDGTSLYFGSVNIDAIDSSGTFKIPLSGGTPARFDDFLTAGGFIAGGALYVDNGNKIAKIALSDATETDLACFPDPALGSINMVHDDSNLYFVKNDGDQYAIHTLPYAGK